MDITEFTKVILQTETDYFNVRRFFGTITEDGEAFTTVTRNMRLDRCTAGLLVAAFLIQNIFDEYDVGDSILSDKTIAPIGVEKYVKVAGDILAYCAVVASITGQPLVKSPRATTCLLTRPQIIEGIGYHAVTLREVTEESKYHGKPLNFTRIGLLTNSISGEVQRLLEDIGQTPSQVMEARCARETAYA